MEDLQDKLWKAIESQDFRLIERLVHLGADLNAPYGPIGTTPFMYALNEFKKAEQIEKLMDMGGNATVSIETFMSDFGIIPMKTAKDEGLMSVDTCKDRVLNLINLNIQNFKNDSWNADNRMNKLLIDLDPKKNKSVFTVRLGGKRIYRCNTTMLPLPQKIEFLTKFYEAVSKGCLNQQIVDFCESEAKLAEVRKQKQKERRKAQRRAEREAYKEKEAEAKKHLPPAV